MKQRIVIYGGSGGIFPNEQVVATVTALHALQKLCSAADIAHLAVCLLSREAGWLTGQVISIDSVSFNPETKRISPVKMVLHFFLNPVFLRLLLSAGKR